MILRIRGMEFDLDFSQDKIWTLEVFHPVFLREIMESFLVKGEENDNRICKIYDGEKEIEDGTVLISNPLDLGVLAALFNKKLKKYLIDNFSRLEDERQFIELAQQIDEFIVQISSEIDFEVDFDEFDFDKFMKVANFRPRSGLKNNNYKQSIYDIIDLMSELSPNHMLCFLNIKQFINREEFENITQYALVKEQKILFLESSFGRFYAKNEKIVVVDEDLYMFERQN